MVGEPGVQGHDGTQALELMREYNEYLEPLSAHEKHAPIVEMVGYWSRCAEILMAKSMTAELMDEFETLQTQIKEVTLAHFTGKQLKPGGSYGCDCRSNIFVGGDRLLGIHHAYTKEGFRVVDGKSVLTRYHNYYEHCTADGHQLEQMHEFGAPINGSSWVLEAANKQWKAILRDHISWKSWKHLDVDSNNHPAKQALKRFIRIVHPSRLRYSVRETRERGPYRCGHCRRHKEVGHLRRNPACRRHFRAQHPAPAPALVADQA